METEIENNYERLYPIISDQLLYKGLRPPPLFHRDTSPNAVMSLSPPLSASAGGSGGEGLAGNRRRWTERDEVRLLRAALEIAEEAAEAFDPSVPLFARLSRALPGSSFTSDEILSKIRELRRSYEEKCYKILVGAAVGAFNNAAFEISNRIWGGAIAGAVTKKRKKSNRKKKKFKKKMIV